MPGTINNEYGKVTISEDIIATVAGAGAGALHERFQ